MVVLLQTNTCVKTILNLVLNLNHASTLSVLRENEENWAVVINTVGMLPKGHLFLIFGRTTSIYFLVEVSLILSSQTDKSKSSKKFALQMVN